MVCLEAPQPGLSDADMTTGGAGRGKRLPLIKSERLDGIQSVRRPPYTTEER